MKILKLLNKKNFSVVFFFIFCFNTFAEDKPVDIWNIDQNNNDTSSNELLLENNSEIEESDVTNIFKMQSQKKEDSVRLEESLNINEIKIYGLYDPEENDLDINMWSNSNGDQLKSIFSRLKK